MERRELSLNTKYGITEEEFQVRLKSQGGVCKICKSPTPKGRGQFHIDHNHSTNEIRGILCHNCNIGLGHFKDNPILLIEAAKYLMEPPLDELTNITKLEGNEEE